MKLYGVVNMDIVKSRKLSTDNRIKIQEKISYYIDYVNKEYSDILIAPIGFTLGDEWQLITKQPSECYNIIHRFQQLLWNDEVDIYAGIGIGYISTKIYSDTRKMDGECFLNARKAINYVKEKNSYSNKYINSKNNRVLFFIDTDKTKNFFHDYLRRQESEVIWEDEIALTDIYENTNWNNSYQQLNFFNLINIIIENTEVLKSKITKKQKQTYIDYLKHRSYRKIISYNKNNNKDESVSSISQKINKSEFFTIQRNHQMIEQLLRYYCELGR